MSTPSPHMDYHALVLLRRSHPGWRLLLADHAPLLISFLHKQFIVPNVRSLSRDDLVSRLEDQLFRLREELGGSSFPRSAAQYLDDWAGDAHGWLRKYYPPGSDEPHFDLTPATEKAIEWVQSLRQRQFVGTESRLLTVFDLLRQLVEGTEDDPQSRIAELEKRRAAIDQEIERIREGRVDLMSSPQIKDRFQQVSATARGLLSDFREVEQNFRDLDRLVRERIAMWQGRKGELLEDIFGERDAISDSDQGRSFRAFWDFLMSPERQEELSKLLTRAFDLPAVQELQPDRRLLRIHYDWLDAGEVAQRNVARLSEQLRRYLDDQAFLEDRRVMQLIRGIEQRALELRDDAPTGAFAEVDALAPELDLAMERPLFTPSTTVRLRSDIVVEGAEEVAVDALFEQVFVDRTRLEAHLRRALQGRSQIALSELLVHHPLEQGLAELVTWLAIASQDARSVISEEDSDVIAWEGADGAGARARVPRVIFVR
ncbi:MAG: DUF3375 domain-containing protein [Myxococcaceae bacterium]